MGISISITAGQDKASSCANVLGTVQHVITDNEVATFKIGDKQLKGAVNSYFGKTPTDAFLHSPTPWNDLYKTYDWEQVNMVLVAQSAEIVDITSEPTIIKTQDFVNNSSIPATFAVSISESVEDTTSSNWMTGGELSIGQEFEYEISFLGSGGGGSTSISYTESWGTGGEHSKAITLGSESGVSMELEPGEAVTAELCASRGVMKVRIRYNAFLIGLTAVNYSTAYKDHHFWGLPIGGVMAAGNISNSILSTEEIEIGYYSNSKIEIRDKISNSLKSVYLLGNEPGGII